MSRLEEINEQYRECSMKRNSYNCNDPYNVGHNNALSDGDEKGKGEKNNQVGSATDIACRNALATKNKFNVNRQYNDSTA